MHARFLCEALRWARDNNLPQSAHICVFEMKPVCCNLSECEMWISSWVAPIYDREKVMSNWRGMLEMILCGEYTMILLMNGY